MLLVAPDPRLGISPERISRVRTLLDGLPTAPGVAVALPGGPDGELDALVLRPDGGLGLLPPPPAPPPPPPPPPPPRPGPPPPPPPPRRSPPATRIRSAPTRTPASGS